MTQKAIDYWQDIGTAEAQANANRIKAHMNGEPITSQVALAIRKGELKGKAMSPAIENKSIKPTKPKRASKKLTEGD